MRRTLSIYQRSIIYTLFGLAGFSIIHYLVPSPYVLFAQIFFMTGVFLYIDYTLS
jgi:hypothetical protein